MTKKTPTTTKKQKKRMHGVAATAGKRSPRHPKVVDSNLILRPKKNDVLCGRGPTCFKHNAKTHWHALVVANHKNYRAYASTDKGNRLRRTAITDNILLETKMNGGRFLRANEGGKGYVEVEHTVAHAKTSQLLRAPKVGDSDSSQGSELTCPEDIEEPIFHSAPHLASFVEVAASQEFMLVDRYDLEREATLSIKTPIPGKRAVTPKTRTSPRKCATSVLKDATHSIAANHYNANHSDVVPRLGELRVPSVEKDAYHSGVPVLKDTPHLNLVARADNLQETALVRKESGHSTASARTTISLGTVGTAELTRIFSDEPQTMPNFDPTMDFGMFPLGSTPRRDNRSEHSSQYQDASEDDDDFDEEADNAADLMGDVNENEVADRLLPTTIALLRNLHQQCVTLNRENVAIRSELNALRTRDSERHTSVTELQQMCSDLGCRVIDLELKLTNTPKWDLDKMDGKGTQPTIT